MCKRKRNLGKFERLKEKDSVRTFYSEGRNVRVF